MPMRRRWRGRSRRGSAFPSSSPDHYWARSSRRPCRPAPATAASRSASPAEEEPLDQASLVIASSRDEAELQYKIIATMIPAVFACSRPQRPEGVSRRAVLVRRRAGAGPLSYRAGEARSPCHRPPVTKKNLAGLVEAYGRSKPLQALAKLVIVAARRGRH